jgi:hypothetical protein
MADDLPEQETDRVRNEYREARWQPRWTILFSLGAGLVLWTGIIWLIRL